MTDEELKNYIKKCIQEKNEPNIVEGIDNIWKGCFQAIIAIIILFFLFSLIF